MSALAHRLARSRHVVAEIVEAELSVRPVSDVRGVCLALGLEVIYVRSDSSDRQTEEVVDLAHPLGVALCQVVVDGDEVHPFSAQGIQVDRERRDQRLALTSLHLGDPAKVKGHAAHQLDIEVALTEDTPCALANRCEGLDQYVVERRTIVESFPKLDG